jgi:hypothetical protein
VTSWSALRVPLWVPQGVLALGATLFAAAFAGGLARLAAGEDAMRQPPPAEAAEREAL